VTNNSRARQPRAAPPRRALATDRTVAVLNYLASRQGHGRGFTLSELVEALDVNVSSLYSILSALVREGYLVRDATRRTYRLGPIPVAIGQAALEGHPAVEQARRATAVLAARFERECLCGILAGSDSVIVAEAGRADRLWMRPRVGFRLPLVPPLTILAAGYFDESTLEAYLDRLGPEATLEDRETYRRAALAAARRGYQVELETPTRGRIGMLMPELASHPGSPEVQSQLVALIHELAREEHTLTSARPGERYAVNNIQAPFFDERGRCLGGLTLLGFDQPLDGDEIASIVRELVAETNRITLAGGGRPPVLPSRE
jgi:DNA-binding IclR family transcriptional regulator